MAKRPTGSKRRTQETSHADDAFVARVFELSTWARGNSQVLILFGVALVVVVAGIVYYVNYRDRMNVLAVQELEAVQQVVAAGDADVARVRLAQYIERFEGTSLATEARLVLARLHLEAGEAGQAVDVLEAADVRVAEPLGPEIAMLLGRAYEARGAAAEAETAYLRVADGAELAFQATEALQEAARLRMHQGDAAGAAELYQRVLDRLEPTDPARGPIEMRLAEARTAAPSS